MTGKLDKCRHDRYGYEGCEECAIEKLTSEIEFLQDFKRQQMEDIMNLGQRVGRLEAALKQFIAACETAPPTSLMIEIGMACEVARSALSSHHQQGE